MDGGAIEECGNVKREEKDAVSLSYPLFHTKSRERERKRNVVRCGTSIRM